MRHTVVGVFDRYAAAEQAARALAARGIDEDDVHVTKPSGDGTFDTQQQEGVMGHVRSFFAELFGPDDEAEVGHYAQAVSRGGAVVRVEVEESEAATVQQTLEQAGAVNVNDEDDDPQVAGPLSDTGVSDGGSIGVPASATAAARLQGDTEGVIPVVREELEVGKRTVNTGGVRVYARTVEKPVHESVELRSEQAVVSRRPVDRPATAADLAALGERSIEVQETAERAVVSKTARVVEEVSVGKKVEQHTEQIDDTVRHTEVDVQRTGGSARAELSPLYRQDFESNYASGGGRWEDYEPAYRHGSTWAADPQYSGRSWDQAEPDLRSAWERDNPGGTWERFKGAVKRGWDKL